VLDSKELGEWVTYGLILCAGWELSS